MSRIITSVECDDVYVALDADDDPRLSGEVWLLPEEIATLARGSGLGITEWAIPQLVTAYLAQDEI